MLTTAPGIGAMADRPLTHTQIDREVRRLLDGARLVCEVDWPDDLVFEVRKAWVSQRSYRPCDFIDQYPGIGVLFLVDYGIRNYEANEFWPPMKLVGAEQGRVGEAFERALRTLGLETFPQFATPAEKARRFVAPILAHGGIPDSMAHAFLTEALFPALRRGHGSTGAEIVARWRRDPPPTLRFDRPPVPRQRRQDGRRPSRPAHRPCPDAACRHRGGHSDRGAGTPRSGRSSQCLPLRFRRRGPFCRARSSS